MKSSLLTLRMLLLGNRRLKRRIELQRLLLDQEVQLAGAATYALKETAIARMTAPTTLALSCGAGLVTGLLNRRGMRTAPAMRFITRQAMWPLLFAGVQKMMARREPGKCGPDA